MRLGGKDGMSLLEKLVVTSQSVGVGVGVGACSVLAAPTIRSAAGATASPAQRITDRLAPISRVSQSLADFPLKTTTAPPPSISRLTRLVAHEGSVSPRSNDH